MTMDDKIRDEKLQCDIIRAAAKISPLSSGKIDKYEYLTGEEVLTPQQHRLIQETKFPFSPLGKALETQVKATEEHREKQRKVTEEQGEKQMSALNGNIKKDDDDGLPFHDSNEDSKRFLRQRKIFEEHYSKRIERIIKS